MPEEKRKKEETYDKISVWYKLHCIQTVELPVNFCWGCNNIPSVFDFTPRLLCTVQGRLCQSKTGSSSRGGALQWFQLGSHRLDYSAFSLFSLKQHALIWPGNKQGTTGDVHTQSKRRTWYKEGKEKRLMQGGVQAWETNVSWQWQLLNRTKTCLWCILLSLKTSFIRNAVNPMGVCSHLVSGPCIDIRYNINISSTIKLTTHRSKQDFHAMVSNCGLLKWKEVRRVEMDMIETNNFFPSFSSEPFMTEVEEKCLSAMLVLE